MTLTVFAKHLDSRTVERACCVPFPLSLSAKSSTHLQMLLLEGCDVAEVHLVASFEEVTTGAQRLWLSSPRLPLRTLVLHREDEAASSMLQKVRRTAHQVCSAHWNVSSRLNQPNRGV